MTILDTIKSFQYPLINYHRTPNIKWPSNGIIRLNNKPVNNTTLYCYFLNKCLCLVSSYNDTPFETNFPLSPSPARFQPRPRNYDSNSNQRQSQNERYHRNQRQQYHTPSHHSHTHHHHHHHHHHHQQDSHFMEEEQEEDDDDYIEEEEKESDHVLESSHYNQQHFSGQVDHPELEPPSDSSNATERLVHDITKEDMVISIFERNDVKNYLLSALLNHIDLLRGVRRTSTVNFETVLKNFKGKVGHVIMWAHFHELIENQDFQPYLDNPASFEWISDILISPKWYQLESLRMKQKYTPWFIVIRNALKEIEESPENPNDVFVEAETRIIDVALQEWIQKDKMSSLIQWVLQFLFTDYVIDIKRKFLYLFGNSSLGKSTFMELLLSPEFFDTHIFSTDYYCSHDRGEYISHCVIFDDPGRITNYNTRTLSGDFFLRLARGGHNNQHLTFQTKHGFVRILKAQVCIISNEPVSRLFPQSQLAAMESRLLSIQITSGNKFPLVFPSSESNPFVFTPTPNPPSEYTTFEEETEEEEETAFHHRNQQNTITATNNNNNSGFQEEVVDDRLVQEQEEEEIPDFPLHPQYGFFNPYPNCQFLDDGARIKSQKFTHRNLFYFLWKAIIKVVGRNLTTQKPDVLASMFGQNTDLLKYFLRNDGLTFYQKFLRYDVSKFKYSMSDYRGAQSKKNKQENKKNENRPLRRRG